MPPSQSQDNNTSGLDQALHEVIEAFAEDDSDKLELESEDVMSS